MKHVTALLIKFVMSTAILYLILGFRFAVPFTAVALTGLAVTLIGYLGDILLMPRIGNTLATLGDLVLSFIVIWSMVTLYHTDDLIFPAFQASALSAAGIAIGEWFFHKYLFRVFNDGARES
ncbi:DUF2512 family protein [Paenactinomyces guangxiensis]|uniref:DUF2512 family protein n=1 Tax=Paenactinomyces guangxiensis TaxID=1490290 RepID=A0A7W1WSD1_9BACL|nr:DUF2512 family protein [Paenactinomyces guangxiensis]MBA4495150.1 DUF2512 family protein [Paenactinomyces guangxiensis]MBH8592166.1 DUF2512 family protein [Paenactinomyces guangxiensis]